jgi:hypothetical protein
MFWLVVILLAASCFGQQSPNGTQPTAVDTKAAASVQEQSANPLKDGPLGGVVIPAGTKVPLKLMQPISTKTAKEGDAVYAQTTFPLAVNNKMIIPMGTFVQGKISEVRRGGRVKGRAELLIHFTSLLYASGYTVALPGSLENLPGAQKSTVKDAEGTIQQDSQTGEKIGTAAKTAGTGAALGGITDGWKGAGIGAGVGGAAGAVVGMLSRGSDVLLQPGTSIEMVIQRDVSLDPSRLQLADK